MRISRDSKFLDGVNYQLHYGFDFGDHRAIPGLGLHHAERLDLLKKDFAQIAENGIHSVRMNVFTDGRTGIVYDGVERAIGVQDSVVTGMVNVLREAAASKIFVSFVMLDHKFAERAEWIDRNKPALGTKQGHARLIATGPGRNELLCNVFEPLLQSIGKKRPQNLLSFEVVNEPESLIQGLSTDTFIQRYIPLEELDQFKIYMRAFRNIARDETGAQFTVGSFALRHAAMWLDVLDPARDYLSIHYYGRKDEPRYQALYRTNRRSNPLKTVKGLQKRIPIVWGEYAANGASDFVNSRYPQKFSHASQFLEDALKNHVKGAFAWALRSGLGDWGDCFGPVPLEQHRRFTALHARHVEFAGALPPALSKPEAA